MYALLVSIAALAAVDVLVLRFRIAGWLAVRAAELPPVRRVLRFRSAHAGGGLTATFSGVVVKVPGSPSLEASAERARFDAASGLILDRVSLRQSPKAPLLYAGRLELTPSGGAVAGRAGQIALGSIATVERAELRAALESPVEIAAVSASGIRVADVFMVNTLSIPGVSISRVARPRVSVSEVIVGVSRAELARSHDGSWNMPDLREARTLATELGNAYAGAVSFYTTFAAGLRSFLFWLVVVLTVAIASTKFLLTEAGLRRRAVSAATTVGLAYALYVAGIQSPLVCLGAGLAAGAALETAIYRRSREWHQRWEPFAADAIAPPLLVLSLAAYGFAWPALPGSPACVLVDELRTGEILAVVRDENLGKAEVRVGKVVVAGVSVDFDSRRLAIQRAGASAISVETLPGFLKSRLPSIVAEDITASPTRTVEALLSARGTADSPMLAQALSRIGYLLDAVRRPAPVQFCLNWRLGAGLAPACESDAQLSLRGFTDLIDPALARHGAEGSIRASGAGLLIRADAAGRAIRLASVRSLPGSAFLVASGTGAIDVRTIPRARLELRGLAAAGFTAGEASLRADTSGARLSARGVKFASRNGTFLSAGSANLEFGAAPAIRLDADVRDVQAFAPSWLDATFPSARARVHGVRRGDRFSGTVQFSGPAALKPVRFSLSPVEGTITVPAQEFSLEPSGLDFLPGCCRGVVQAEARLRSLAPFGVDVVPSVRVGNQPVSLLPVKTELKHLRVEAGGAFDSLWSIGYPAFPRSFDLREITGLKLQSEGVARGFRLDSNPLPNWSLPPLPAELRIQGSAAGPISIAAGGNRFEIGREAPGIGKIVIRDGRLSELTLFTGGVAVALRASAPQVSISGAEGWTLTADPHRLSATAARADMQLLWASAAPLLESFGVSLPGLQPAAEVLDFKTDLDFSNDSLTAARARFRIASGPLGRVDLRSPPRAASAEARGPIDVSLATSRTEAGELSLMSSLAVSPIVIDVNGDGELRTTLALDAQVRGDLSFKDLPRTPIRDTFTRTATALQPHLRAAFGAFAPEAASGEWNVRMTGGATLGPERWSAKLDLPEAAVAADLVAHRNALIVDASATFGTFAVPILAAFINRAESHIDNLWDGFTPRNAVEPTGIPELSIGNLALQQVRIAPPPLAVQIGSSAFLDLSAPLSADVFYGKLASAVQARIGWRDGLACAAGQVAGTLSGFQADALQVALQGTALPLISDQFDATFAFRAGEVCFNRGRAPSDLFERLGLRLAIARTGHAPPHGYLQMSSGTVLQLRNEVLRNIVRDLEMKTLPSGLRYRDLKFTLEAENGRVESREPLLTLGGIRYFTSDQVDVGGELRLHLVPPAGDHISVRGLLEWLRDLQ